MNAENIKKYWIDNSDARELVSKTYPEFHKELEEIIRALVQKPVEPSLSPEEMSLRLSLNAYLGFQRSRLFADLIVRDGGKD